MWWVGPCGHEWEATIQSRARRGAGCPYCASRRLHPDRSLAVLSPQLAAQWHPTKNHPLTPADVPCHSARKVWWVGSCGHEWETSVGNRSAGKGCPYCASRLIHPDRSLAVLSPQLAAQWHPIKNQPLTPDSVSNVSNRKVWWAGPCGHEWEARISSRNRGVECPYCASVRLHPGCSLAIMSPQLAAQWHPARNHPLAPADVTRWSARNVWWVGTCGHEWEARVCVRDEAATCPRCAPTIFYFTSSLAAYIAAVGRPTTSGRL